MIKATDLRLNNLLIQDGETGKVLLLAADTIIVKHKKSEEPLKLTPDDVDGMPLTIDLLEFCGFTPSGVNNEFQLVIDKDIIITVNRHISGGISVQLCVKDNWCGKPVQYLHELQNIYLDLTGKELIVRLA